MEREGFVIFNCEFFIFARGGDGVAVGFGGDGVGG